jgi:hypothetical protein
MMDQAIKSYIEQLVRAAVQQSANPSSTRTSYAIANWKMNKTFSEMAGYLQELKEGTTCHRLPASPALVSGRFDGQAARLLGQHWRPKRP